MSLSFFGFGQSADVTIQLNNEPELKTARVRQEDGSYEVLPLFYDGESVDGEVKVVLKRTGQKLEHQGIRVDLIGQIEVYYDRGNQHDFIFHSEELAKAGAELVQRETRFPFSFPAVSKPYESYVGVNVKLRYFLRVTILRRLTDITSERELVVQALATYPDIDGSIKMEVGIEDCLHIEFEYSKSRYHLKDVIVGKIYFLLVRIKIKFMEIAILKRESVGSGPNLFHENETIAKYEIMDGAPVKGESIPIRLFLSGYDLTPTMRDVGKRFSVRYFLNLVLVDEEDRRYFKQQEITLWRKADMPLRRRPLAEQMLPNQPTQQLAQEQEQGADGGLSASTATLHGSGEDEERSDEGENQRQKESGKSGKSMFKADDEQTGQEGEKPRKAENDFDEDEE